MNFLNMKYFLETADTGNITRAAARLQISQQALSNTIARIEAELGCQQQHPRRAQARHLLPPRPGIPAAPAAGLQ
mgnify:CR=1 FL=1